MPSDEELDKVQETEVQDEVIEDNDNVETNPTDDNTDSAVSDDKTDDTVEDSKEDYLPSPEDLDNLTDDEFEEFLNSGKLASKEKSVEQTQNKPVEQETPVTPSTQAKVVSKPKKQESDTTTQVQPKTSPDINYEAVYKQLFKPFKANGKEITPRSPEDIISLMQMGANYTRKMQLMAPMRKVVQSISNANIKEDDLNFLIDVYKGDKEAIKSLLKKHEIDPMELDLDEISYKANRRNIASDSDVEFTDTLQDINDTLPQIQEIINTRWDAQSKEALLRNPNLMRALSEELQLGRFDRVQKIVEQEKIFGRYKGVSDVDAYIDVVTKLVQDEQRKQQYKQNQETAKKANPQIEPTKPVPNKAKAAPTKAKSKASKSTLTPEDLFSMSEEEFNKLSINDLV